MTSISPKVQAEQLLAMAPGGYSQVTHVGLGSDAMVVGDGEAALDVGTVAGPNNPP
jgi:hypothetical protein